MRIRTRYRWFRIIGIVAVVTFLVSLWDMFGNGSAWFLPIMGIYILLAIIALILYIGHKPDLDDEILAIPEPMPPQDEVEEVTRDVNVQGPHHFRCPFCANIFALELTHLKKEHDLRMDCPFCANTIRIPRRPKLAPGQAVRLDLANAQEQAVFTCENCGEVLRYTAPGQDAGARARVHSCPHCGSERVDPASGAAA